jgi:hypothetical protein
MSEWKNLSDPSESLVWRILDNSDTDEAVEEVLEQVAARYAAAHPEQDARMAQLFFYFVCRRIISAVGRIKARRDTYCGLQVGGSA